MSLDAARPVCWYAPMRGLMQDRPLLVSTLIEHAADCHAGTPIVSRELDDSIHTTSWGEVAARSRRLARALLRLGVRPGDRVATLAWNTHRHLELYYGISGIGAVCHTVNPRLFFEQILYIVRHAEDAVLCFDTSFIDIVQRLAQALPGLRTLVALGRRRAIPELDTLRDVIWYEDLIGAEPDDLDWPVLDENQAASLCYTSGTTGHPKGVLYSHRSTVLHAYAAVMPDCFNVSAADVIMPVASMYHANSWGMPYAATLAGARLVLPGTRADPVSLQALIASYGVTISSGVPTIWLGVIQHLQATGGGIAPLRRILVGGSAVPPALIEAFADYGVELRQAWGMTETSPLGVVNVPKSDPAALDGAALQAFRARQGRTVYGVQLKLVDDAGGALPHDGVTAGNVLIRGWWIADRYYGQDGTATIDGWFPTGDVATLDPDGFLRITDRAKDIIKSGGEWISSIDLENAAVAHPAVAEAAVVGVPHPKWDERPLLILRLRAGASLPAAEMLGFLRERVAKWWLPDDIIVVDDIPHTATGKILKSALRAQYAQHLTGRPAPT